jgi:hypothetical protein
LQALHKCNLGTEKKYPVACTGTMDTLNTPPLTRIYEDMYTLTTANAVHAIAMGVQSVSWFRSHQLNTDFGFVRLVSSHCMPSLEIKEALVDWGTS